VASACSDDSRALRADDGGPLVEAGTRTPVDGRVPVAPDGHASHGRDAGRRDAMPGDARTDDRAVHGGSTADAFTPDAAGPDSTTRGLSLFNGVDLTGWSGDPTVWRVVNGEIVGSAPKVPGQSFLIYQGGPFADFVLTAEVLLGTGGNTGIQYRSTVTGAATWQVAGYQFDAANTYWGALYEQGGRGTILLAKAACLAAVKPTDYNDFELRAAGPALLHRINGVDCIAFTETVAGKPTTGVIALQYHPPGGYEVRFRNIRLHELGPPRDR